MPVVPIDIHVDSTVIAHGDVYRPRFVVIRLVALLIRSILRGKDRMIALARV